MPSNVARILLLTLLLGLGASLAPTYADEDIPNLGDQ